MNEYEALKDLIADEQFAKEPLASAILCVLEQEYPAISRKILDQFNEIIYTRIDTKVQEHMEEQNCTEDGRIIIPPEG